MDAYSIGAKRIFSRRKFISASATLLASKAVFANVEAPQKPVKIFAVADIHSDTCKNEGAKNYGKSLGKLKAAIKATEGENFDFTANFGDIIDRTPQCADAVLDELSKTKAPLKNILGNHDFRGSATAQRKMLQKLFGEKSSYYSFACGEWDFIVLDSMRLSRVSKIKNARCAKQSQDCIEKTKGAVNSAPWGGGIDSEQLEWLESELEKSSKRGRKAAVFCHMTILPLSHASMFNYEEVADVLERHRDCAKIFVCGHKHDGGYTLRNGIHYLTLKSLLEYDSPTYAIISFKRDEIEVGGFGAEVSRRLKLE